MSVCSFLYSTINPDSLLSVYEVRKNTYSDTEKAEIFSQIGSAYYKVQNFPEAIKFQKMAREIFHSTNNPDKEIDELEKIGVLYSNISIYDESLYYLLEALKIANRQRDIPREYSLMLNIGTTHIEASNYENGLIYLKKCKNYYEKSKGDNDKYKFALYTNLGVVYQHYDLLDTARLYYLNALDICRKSQELNMGGVLINIGDLYALQDSLLLAREYYELAIDHFYKSNDMRGYWHTKYGLARLSIEQGDFPDAITRFDELVAVFEETQDLAYLSQSFLDLSKLYDELGDYKMSLSYYKKYSEINSKISSSDVLMQMAQFEMKYELEIFEQQAELDIEIVKREKQLVLLKWYVFSGILIIGLLIVIVFMTRHRIKKKLLESELKNSQLEQNLLGEEIEFHKRELENFALNIVHKNNLLLSIKNELNELKDVPDNEKNSKARNISMQISQALKRNSDLEKLQERIDKVHFSFIQKLSENFPSLTEKEKRLCVMLKLNLSSKEIAVLNDISEHAVMMARYRMRKRMNMNSEENLVDFLQKL